MPFTAYISFFTWKLSMWFCANKYNTIQYLRIFPTAANQHFTANHYFRYPRRRQKHKMNSLCVAQYSIIHRFLLFNKRFHIVYILLARIVTCLCCWCQQLGEFIAALRLNFADYFTTRQKTTNGRSRVRRAPAAIVPFRMPEVVEVTADMKHIVDD